MEWKRIHQQQRVKAYSDLNTETEHLTETWHLFMISKIISKAALEGIFLSFTGNIYYF